MLLSAVYISVLIAVVAGSDGTLGKLLDDGFKRIDVTADDGITLKAILFDPKPTSDSGKNPAIIFPSSWGLNKWEYVVPAKEYADKGYTIISYTCRGFWESGGEINMAGPLDMADLTTLVNYLVQNTNADPERIGMSGISYGGGISIMATGFEPRIKSISAMSCWVDLTMSFLGNGETIRKEAARFLDVAAEVVGEMPDELTECFDDYFANTNLELMYDIANISSATTYLDQINANKPAVFIANAYGDSLFTPNQFPSAFDTFTGPKHIEFAPGDHAGPELVGLFGLPNQVWTRAGEWNDFYLLNNHAKDEVDPSIPLVVLNTMNGDEVEEYKSWEDITTSTLNFQFSSKESLVDMDGQKKTSSGEVSSLVTGKGANINGGLAYISQTVRGDLDVQRRFRMKHISREHGVVFISDKLAFSHRIRGTPKLEVTIIPEATNGTIIAYLLDVDALDVGHMFTFSPWTFKNALPGEPLTLPIEITMTAYDIEKGRRIGLVVSAKDALYLDQNPSGVSIGFDGSSMLSIPIHA